MRRAETSRPPTVRGQPALAPLLVLVALFQGSVNTEVEVVGGVETGREVEPREALEKARELIGRGELEEAVSILREHLESRPEDADAHLMIGNALALLPRRIEALEAFREAIRLRPDSAPAYNIFGMALTRFVELEPARLAFQRALELDPGFTEAHLNLALVLAQLGEFEAAGNHAEAVSRLEEDPRRAAYAHYIHGWIHLEREQSEEAVGAFERALELRPDYAEAYLFLGLVRRKRLEFGQALAALQKAAELSSGDARIRHELGKEYLQADRAAEALGHLKEAARLSPGDPGILYSLFRAYRLNGRNEEARDVLDRLAEHRERADRSRRHSLRASELNNEGVRLEEGGEIRAAVGRYREALDLDPLQTVFRRNLGLALCRLGLWDEGLRELREVLELDPDDGDATRAYYIALEMVAAGEAETGAESTGRLPDPE